MLCLAYTYFNRIQLTKNNHDFMINIQLFVENLSKLVIVDSCWL